MSVCFELPQESENALAIKIRQQVLDKIARCTSEEELKKTLVSILSENDQNLDLEKIQQDVDVLKGLDNFLICSITETPDNLSEKKIDVANILSNAIDLVCNPPNLEIPYPFPVFDPSGDFLQKLLIAILRLAIKILLSIVRKLLSLLLEICNSGLSALNNFGGINIADSVNESIGQGLGRQFINDVFNAFGLNDTSVATIIQVGDICEQEATNALGVSNLNNENDYYFNDDEQLGVGEGNISFNNPNSNNNSDLLSVSQALKDANDLLNDISLMLTPVEICSLFNGRASEETFKLIEELLNYEYPHFRTKLNTREKISNFFELLGSRNDPSICEVIENNAQLIISKPELCFTNNVNDIREKLLKDKEVNQDDIKQQIDKERDRNKDNLEKLAELASIISTNPDKIFGEKPNIFCKDGKQGLVSLDDMPSLQTNMGVMMDSTFNVFADVFRKNIQDFPNKIIVSEKTVNKKKKTIKKFIDIITKDEDGRTSIIENGLNNKFTQKVTSEQYTLCDDQGRTDKKSILDYYGDAKVNGIKVKNGKSIDANTLVNAPNYNSVEDVENVYIINYDTKQKVLPDIIEDILPEIDEFLTFDINKMTIDFKIPNKYSAISSTNEKRDLSSVPSDDKVSLYVKGE